MSKTNIFIAGAGGMGRAAALLLESNEAFDCSIILGDKNEAQVEEALSWIAEAFGETHVIGFVMENEAELHDVLGRSHVLLDCLPGSLAPQMASHALKHNLHYANLTEYVNETAMIVDMAKDAKTGFVLQTGLAPGYINVLARRLFERFKAAHPNAAAQHMQMKVGALSKNALAPSHYAFTWSPIGVATEYVKDAIIVRNHKRKVVPALSGRSKITIDGVVYEDNFTSGGAANLPSALASEIQNIDYKTLRYPGHYKWIEKSLSKIPISEDRVKKLFDVMLDNIPVVDDDVVIIYAAVSGKDESGLLRSYETSKTIYPMHLGNQTLRAIQATTASALCEVAYYLSSNKHHGIILQTDLETDVFLNGPFVKPVYGDVK